MKQHPYLPDLDTPVDYSLTQNWLCLPKKIAKPDDKPVDIFYLYPTAYYKTPHGPNICEVNNEAMRIRAAEHLQTKASVFSAYGNFYAPAYRQAALECLLDNTPENNLLFTKGPVTCVLSAFDYYIKHHNNGRPFILAGHSQGSLLLQFILSLYLKEHPEVQERMIAAYVIGYSITRGYLKDNPHLTFARGAKDTGVIISYNTRVTTSPCSQTQYPSTPSPGPSPAKKPKRHRALARAWSYVTAPVRSSACRIFPTMPTRPLTWNAAQ